MSLFGENKISHHEFRKALSHLKEKGFTEGEIDEVVQVFRGDLDESGGSDGISKEELKKGIRFFREHPYRHHLSPEQISRVEEVLKHYV